MKGKKKKKRKKKKKKRKKKKKKHQQFNGTNDTQHSDPDLRHNFLFHFSHANSQ